MASIRNKLSFANVMAAIAVFLVLGGSAVAVTKVARNSVTSPSIKNGAVTGKDVKDDSLTGADVDESSLALPRAGGTAQPTGPAGGDLTDSYPNPKIAPNAVDSGKVADGSLTGADAKDDSLTGADVQESSLGEVPAATLGGLGRYGFNGSCDPETSDFTPCSVVTVDLPNPARMLVIGTAQAVIEPGASYADGYCQIGTTSGPVEASRDFVRADGDDAYESLTVMAVTNVFSAGRHSFGIDCNEGPGGITYPEAHVAAVALSAD